MLAGDTLRDWLVAHGIGSGDIDVRRGGEAGASNELYEVTTGGRTWMLRRPPADHHDPEFANRIVCREFRVLQALDGTPVPHPRVTALCDDPSVFGACFYLMEKIDGFTPMGVLPAPFDTDLEARRAMAYALFDTLAELANVDWRARGLEGFGKPDGFLDRQVDRWLGHLAAFKFREMPGLDVVAAWLRRNTPPMSPPAIIHGDYQFANVMYAQDPPVRLVAVIDWEQSTIGDPLLDLGWLVMSWPRSDDDQSKSKHYFPMAGLPRRDELLKRYAERTGRDVSRIDYYRTLAAFKLACVLEGAYARWVKGTSAQPKHEFFGPIVLDLLASAANEVSSK